MHHEFDFRPAFNRLLSIREEQELYHELERCAHDPGFSRFAMGHHVDLLGPPDDAVRLTNYDPACMERSLGEDYFADDPVHRASMKTASGSRWSAVPDMIQLTPHQTENDGDVAGIIDVLHPKQEALIERNYGGTRPLGPDGGRGR